MTKIKQTILFLRQPIVFMINLLIIALAYLLAFYLRFDFNPPHQYFEIISRTLPLVLLIKILVFRYFDLFSGMWRYVSMEDLWQILKANVIATVLFILCIVFFVGFTGYPRSVFVLDWGLCLGLIAGVRFLSRGLREHIKPLKYKDTVKVLIVGAGEAGVLVFKELKRNMNYDIVGFVDDDLSKRGMKLHGKKILGGKEDIESIVKKQGIQEIVLAMPSEKGEVIRDIVSYCHHPGVKLQIVPGMYKILKGDLQIKLREVQPEDLLGRETVEVDEQGIKNYIKGKVVLVTGGAGSIGSEIVKQVAGYSPEKLILIDYNENDIYFLQREVEVKFPDVSFVVLTADCTKYSVLKHTFSKYRPDIVFHAAAFKHVPLMEDNPSAAIKNNVVGSRNLIYASEHYGVERFVLISSDKAVNPTNVMGATKRMAEMILQAKARKSKTKFIAVRFGNVLGSKGSVVPLFKKQIEEDRKVTVTHPDTKRFFMSIKEAVQLVLQAGEIGKSGEIMVLDMGEQINIADFARNLIRLSGLTPDKDVIVAYIGLRPGEKMYEETLHDTEKDMATKHEKIFVTNPADFDIKHLNKQIKDLKRLARLMNNQKIREKLKSIVPSYTG